MKKEIDPTKQDNSNDKPGGKQQTPPDSTQPMLAPQKTFIVPILASIIVVLLGISGFFAYQYFIPKNQTSSSTTTKLATAPAANPTTDWKTYEDSKYGFIFRYPKNWHIRDMLPSSGDLPPHKDKFVYLGLAPNNMGYDYIGSFSLTTESIDEIITLIESTTTNNSNSKIISKIDTDFLSLPATEIVFRNLSTNDEFSTLIFSRNNISYLAEGVKEDVVKSILSTLKFTEPQTPKDPASDWLSYTDNIMGLTFKYPPTWDYHYLDQTSPSIMIAPTNIVDKIKNAPGGFGGGPFLTMTISLQDYEPINQTDEFSSVVSYSATIDSRSATKYVSTFLQDGPGFETGQIIDDYVLPLKDKYLKIALLDQDQKETLDKIVSLISFTK